MLLLGTFLFADFEIPSSISFSGKQSLAVHKLIGGQRVIDAMGPDADDIKWSGRFQGGDAVSRARQLETMRDDGQPIILVCGPIAKTVVISSFHFDYERSWQGPYEIVCTVVPDDDGGVELGLDQIVETDMAYVGIAFGF